MNQIYKEHKRSQEAKKENVPVISQPITPEQQFNSIVEWQRKTFPDATAYSKIKHLEEEIEELLIELAFQGSGKNHEFADCFMLLFGAAATEGLSFKEIFKAIDEKMTINLNRKWGKPDENGVVKHIK